MNRVVVKLGTRVLTNDYGQMAHDRLAAIVGHLARLIEEGRQVILVSSGAVGLGRDAIGLPPGPSDLATRQACAAIGQSRLMGVYEGLFAQHNLCCAQVLLTQSDFDDTERYENLTRTLGKLMQHRVVPIVNENDVVATEELAYVRPKKTRKGSWNSTHKSKKMSFGDNDQLASILASKLEAELLILLTDVDAVYDKNPNKYADAKPIKQWTVDIEVNSDQDAGAGRGGMRSKIRSASQAARAGCTAVIASGRDDNTLKFLFTTDPPGTWFQPVGRLSQKHQWIALASTTHGVLVVNDKATDRMRTERASVFATDIIEVEGDFATGQVVEVRDQANVLLGRGATSYPSDIARAWSIDPHETHAKRDVVVIRWDQLTQEPQR